LGFAVVIEAKIGRPPCINKRSLLLKNNHSLSTPRSGRRAIGPEVPTVRRVTPDADLELRHLRTFIAVAQRRSFTRAAADLHIAQQAVSQQIKALERSLGVTLMRRTSRQVELTGEGTVFLADCRRVVAAIDRASARVRAAARGESGTLRLAYTLTCVWDTLPQLLARISEVLPQVRVEAREVFGVDIPELLLDERFDVAVAPRTSYAGGFHSRIIRNEPLRLVVSKKDPLARRKRVHLSALAGRLFEVWPRDMAPGFYDTVVGTCRAAGFEPALDEQAAGNMVWGNLARGRGVALINASLVAQIPPNVALIDLSGSSGTIGYEAVWHQGDVPLIDRTIAITAALAAERNWV
jgi:DNA-binding transcriptional LysR family regulator